MTFFSKGFGAKCKHAELALNFIQKQSFSEIKTHFPFTLVEQEQRETGKSCF